MPDSLRGEKWHVSKTNPLEVLAGETGNLRWNRVAVMGCTIAETQDPHSAPYARARLIAAAPDLLDALKEAHNRLYVHQGETTKALVAKCAVAIAKAQGPQTAQAVPSTHAGSRAKEGTGEHGEA